MVISGNFGLLSLGYLQLSKISARSICEFFKMSMIGALFAFQGPDCLSSHSFIPCCVPWMVEMYRLHPWTQMIGLANWISVWFGNTKHLWGISGEVSVKLGIYFPGSLLVMSLRMILSLDQQWLFANILPLSMGFINNPLARSALTSLGCCAIPISGPHLLNNLFNITL